MNESKKIVALFQQAEQMIVDYLGMIETTQHHMRLRLRKGTPLPEGVRVALISPDDISFLQDALNDLDLDKRGIVNHLASIQINLARSEPSSIANAKNFVTSWGVDTDRAMETVINQSYRVSDILPPPLHYWSKITEKFITLFPYVANNQKWAQNTKDTAHYLNTVENPWAKYTPK